MDSAVGVEKNIRIAFQGPLSGPEASLGNDELDGVKFAIQQFNKRFRGVFNVSVVLIDDQGDPAIAQKIAPTFAAIPTILGIVGPSYSGASIASIPFYKAQDLAMISPSAVRTSITDPAQGAIGFPVFHRIPSLEKVEGPSLYKIATQGVSVPKVVIVDDKSAYGAILSQSIRSFASSQNIVATVSVGTSAAGIIDWSGTVNTVKSSAANVVIYAGYTPQAATLYTQLRTSGYKGILAGGEGVNSSIFDYATSSVLEGVRLSAGTAPLSGINADLESNFRLLVGKPSGAYAAESIDATNVLLYCIATGVTTRKQMLNCIDGFWGTSIYGHRFGFDRYGDNIKEVFHGFEIKSGSIKLTQTLGRTKESAAEIIASFPWYNISPVAEGVNVTIVQFASYTDRSNKLNDALNAHLELLDALNAAIQDALDAESFSPLPAFTAQLGTLDSKLLVHSQNLDELVAIEDSACSIVNSDVTNTEESIILQDICAEFKDALAAATDAFNAAEFSTDDVRGWLAFLQNEKNAADAKAAADLKTKQDADAKAAAALKAKQEADAKAAADLKAKQEADAKAAADLKAKQEADAKAAAALKAKQEADAKAAADLKAKQEADAKVAADLRAKLEADTKAAADLRAKLEADVKVAADAKAAADLRAKQEADAKATADLRAKQEADAKAAADLKAKQEADAKAAAAKAAAAKAKKSGKVTCKKGSIVKVFVAKKCPAGYTK
ncbi:MAG: branched-chain amino acid ABC transporter substrate-binding protein [Proteobacteria bacterium]|nr:branched-chain amino acid ABC transporter substrate-binding protein [Pseudomonadota bacterium]